MAVQLWVRAGGRDEAATELGLAHYLEHMLFKGTTTRAKGFVDRDVEAVGGRINAGTSRDFTYYHVVLPAPRTVAAIEMLADISVNSSLDETELELEKKVVIEEMRLSEDTPQRHLVRQLYGDGVRRSSVRPLGARHARDHPEPDSRRPCSRSTAATMCPSPSPS